jgi:hypothetical protein
MVVNEYAVEYARVFAEHHGKGEAEATAYTRLVRWKRRRGKGEKEF